MTDNKGNDELLDEILKSWMADMEIIRQDIHELFWLRRMFRDLAEVFQNNRRLQSVGGHLWDWMRLNYAASMLIRLRRMVDSQSNTINLKQLMHAIIEIPNVLSRRRRRAFLPARSTDSEMLRELLEREFTSAWVRNPDAQNPDDDHVDPGIVREDLRTLEKAVERAAAVTNRAVAHLQRVKPGEITFKEVDEAFDAVEKALEKYYALICGASIVGAEPAPQFNTHEVFTFPWIEPRNGDE